MAAAFRYVIAFMIGLRGETPSASSIGITVIVFSEMAGSTNGIGFRILQAQRQFAITDMWAGMLFLGIVGYLVNIAFRGVESCLLRWHRGMQRVDQR